MNKEYIVELRKEEVDKLIEDHWVGELVRCKDCQHLSSSPSPFPATGVPFCERIHKFVSVTWYCADGERKGGEGND